MYNFDGHSSSGSQSSLRHTPLGDSEGFSPSLYSKERATHTLNAKLSIIATLLFIANRFQLCSKAKVMDFSTDDANQLADDDGEADVCLPSNEGSIEVFLNIHR